MGQVHVDGEIARALPQFDDDGILTSINYSAVLFKTKTRRTQEDNIPKWRVEYRQLRIGAKSGTDSTVKEVNAITES